MIHSIKNLWNKTDKVMVLLFLFLFILLFLDPAVLAYAQSDYPTSGNVFKRLIVGGFGRFAMAVLGIIGLGCFFIGGGEGKGDEESDTRVLIGAFCLLLLLVMFLYRIKVWRDTMGTMEV